LSVIEESIMPEYTYRREDGTTFTIKQKFTDSALTTDPNTGQKVWRVVQNAGVIFKGSGFYVNDSKGSKSALTNTSSNANNSTTTDKPATTSDAPKADSTSTSNTPAKSATTTPSSE
jgi:predicted nucleic acid-binding Zn ribbon protein